jgi:bifunctional UDP-N-acetylglucosamine pyrophosphorylase / glucosamine-1-phosphate N-acetyltransferase
MPSTSRVLIVPAAGAGSRLGGRIPKLLVPVAGIPMIDRIIDLYRDHIDDAVLVVNPACVDDVRRHIDAGDGKVPFHYVEQASPTGMLDAILLAAREVDKAGSESIWITWCDQVAVRPATIDALSSATVARPQTAIVMPTSTREHPYIHLERDGARRITRVLQRREGDAMPATGESDIGVFALSRAAYTDLLPRYAREVEVGGATRERNFLPFIPWVARAHEVLTFPCTDPMEAVGVNTPEELKQVEEYLRRPA